MGEPKILSPAALAFRASPEAEVFRFQVKAGVLLCLTAPGTRTGGGLWVPFGTPEVKIAAGLETARTFAAAQKPGSAKSVEARIVASHPDALVARVEGWCRANGVTCIKTVMDAGQGFEAWLYPQEGRLRLAREEANRMSAESAPSAGRKKRVLIVDDSQTIRDLLKRILNMAPDLEVVGSLADPLKVEAAIRELKPDVMTLDIHMPGRDGCEVLRQIMPRTPIPTVMISSISKEEGTQVLEALELGAVDYVQKPSLHELDQMIPVIQEKVRTAANARMQRKTARPAGHSAARLGPLNLTQEAPIYIAIGSSTGGTETLREILTQLPADIPPILIVQHIPAVFSQAFARRLAELCPFEVKEAEDRDDVRPGRVLIAPGGLQMKVESAGTRAQPNFVVRITEDPAVNRHRPSVDYLFDSVADLMGDRAIGAILTGMGADGARGLLRMRQRGARTLAQDEATSVVYGMPREAAKMGAAEKIVALPDIPEALTAFIRQLQAPQKSRTTA